MASLKFDVKNPVADTWIPEYIIGSGGFGTVLLARDRTTQNNVAIKVDNEGITNTLDIEEQIYKRIKIMPGFCQILASGVHSGHRYLVMTRLGNSLTGLMDDSEGKLSIDIILRCAKQAVRLLQRLHGRGIIHCDVKPDNLVLGPSYGTENEDLYLIDFGRAVCFVDEDIENHRPLRFCTKYPATLLYGPSRAFQGHTLSRRDDLVGLLYSLVYLRNGTLPWSHLLRREKDVLKMKKSIAASQLCEGFPIQVTTAWKYIKSLKYSEYPDYDHLYSLFSSALQEIGQS